MIINLFVLFQKQYIDKHVVNDIYKEFYHECDKTEREYLGALRTTLPSLVYFVQWFVYVQVTIFRSGADKFKVLNEGSYVKLTVTPGKNGNVLHNWETWLIIIIKTVFDIIVKVAVEFIILQIFYYVSEMVQIFTGKRSRQ